MGRRRSVPEGPLTIARQFTGGIEQGEKKRKCRRHD
jgi:hypothetical protein